MSINIYQLHFILRKSYFSATPSIMKYSLSSVYCEKALASWCQTICHSIGDTWQDRCLHKCLLHRIFAHVTLARTSLSPTSNLLISMGGVRFIALLKDPLSLLLSLFYSKIFSLYLDYIRCCIMFDLSIKASVPFEWI